MAALAATARMASRRLLFSCCGDDGAPVGAEAMVCASGVLVVPRSLGLGEAVGRGRLGVGTMMRGASDAASMAEFACRLIDGCSATARIASSKLPLGC